MPVLTYQPHHYDADETTVDGVTFRAYEAVEVDNKPGLVSKLSHNPWFTDGAVDVERKLEWEKVRSAQKAAADDAAAAEKAAADPKAEAFRATAHINKFRTPPGGEAVVVDKSPVEVKFKDDGEGAQGEADPIAGEIEIKPETEPSAADKPKGKTKKDKE